MATQFALIGSTTIFRVSSTPTGRTPHFAVCFDRALRDAAIPLHRSGDEFTAVLPVENPEEALTLAYRVRREMTPYKLTDVDAITLSVTMGMAMLRPDDPRPYRELEGLAERAVKPDGTKLRGTVRFASVEGANRTDIPAAGDLTRKRAVCISKGSLAVASPFESPWLNFLSRLGFNLAEAVHEWSGFVTSLDGATRDFLSWIAPAYKKGIVRSAISANDAGDYEPVFSAFDIAVAVSHRSGPL